MSKKQFVTAAQEDLKIFEGRIEYAKRIKSVYEERKNRILGEIAFWQRELARLENDFATADAKIAENTPLIQETRLKIANLLAPDRSPRVRLKETPMQRRERLLRELSALEDEIKEEENGQAHS
jgi:hypothetical protein